MKLSKKIGLGLVTLLAMIILTACSSKPNATKIITMKGDYVTVMDMYDAAKKDPQKPITTLLQNLTLGKVLDKEFGKKVTDKDVQAKFDETKKGYETQESFSSALQQQGMTEETFRANLREQLLQKAAIDKEVEDTQLTEDNLKSAWTTYHPEVDTYISMASSQDDANQLRDAATQSPDEFKKQAKEKKLEQKFDASSTVIPKDVMTAAFNLQNDQISDVIPVQGQDGTSSYYVVYMINNPGKGDDMNKYKSQLKDYIKSQKAQDQNFVTDVIKKYLTKYNVTVKEPAFSNIFSNFSGISTGQ